MTSIPRNIWQLKSVMIISTLKTSQDDSVMTRDCLFKSADCKGSLNGSMVIMVFMQNQRHRDNMHLC